ncbi:hypothetical protein TH2_01355 [Thalassospira profundimaris WP0211]|nr:hypothetical protein TH2_01355 [Thalassospira profundimaris WP0211]
MGPPKDGIIVNRWNVLAGQDHSHSSSDGKIWPVFGHDKRQFCTNSFPQRMNVQIFETKNENGSSRVDFQWSDKKP